MQPGLFDIYLLHFDGELSAGMKRHYVGRTRDLAHRLESHLQGTGSVAAKKAVSLGLSIRLAKVWKDRTGHIETWASFRADELCPLYAKEGCQAR